MKQPTLFALVSVVLFLVAAFTPLALLGESETLGLRSGATSAAEVAGAVWWLSSSLFVCATAVVLGGVLRRVADEVGQWPMALAALLPILTVGCWFGFGFESDFLILSVVHSLGAAFVFAASSRTKGDGGTLALSMPGGFLVLVANWSALFLE